ncbi:MAG: type IX secretion system outer membrane channel protein PorV [Bacteroidales bacterium]|nr:type IX secretion system outer membrane channel protein PorV [Bacteroidales bacterium]MCF8387299.1 type IX secretion system outer membrane channel protein PorV [Bacteroidales bacterium]MCF8396719.1 type IX secretion system outer membrane channel protein PorV [Bacteroidales bacterium]
MRKLASFLGLFLIIFQVSGQGNYDELSGKDLELNPITTAVPFLTIAPDARGGAMGDAGVSSTPDANSMHWNPAKYAFIDGKMGISASYSPWLRDLVNDINLAYLTGYYRFDQNQVIAASLRYFSLGDIVFTDNNGLDIGTYQPNEFSFAATYSRKLTTNLSGAVAGRFIYSNLTLGQTVGSQDTKAGTSVAADVSVYWRKEINLFDVNAVLAWGVNISNIGNKISYTDNDATKDFLPTNLRLGPSITLDLDEFNQLSFMVDINKLLVPTPPIYAKDTSGNFIIGPDNKLVVAEGMDPDVSVIKGMLQSFYDAPGGFSEEMRELMYSFGVEYWYDQQFAIRGGFFYEDRTKGNRKFFTLGAGLRYNLFGLDVSYLIPLEQQNPLENTLRFSLYLDFEAFSGQNN